MQAAALPSMTQHQALLGIIINSVPSLPKVSRSDDKILILFIMENDRKLTFALNNHIYLVMCKGCLVI